jgi:DNA-binding response OmpR family regulator
MTQRKVLVVDDDPDVRLSLHVRLKANNYDVFFAVDGVSAISEARKHTPDLILLDLGLPAGDGFCVLEWLQANDTLAAIPVIVLTGRDRNASKGRSFSSGAKAFLQKPVANAQLLSVMRQVLEGKGHNAELIYNLSGAVH